MAREYFCAYHSYFEAIEPLNYEERGKLFTACLLYSMAGKATQFTGNERFLFPQMRSQIDRDRDRYDMFCQKQRENVSKRWATPKEASAGEDKTSQDDSSMPTDTIVSDGIPTDANRYQPYLEKEKEKEKEKTKTKTKAKETETEKAKNVTRTKYASKPPAGFDEFWSGYPKKKAKGDARRAWQGVDVEVAVLLTAIERQRQSPQWKREGGQYIPHPATWLRGRRWEDGEDEAAVEPKVHDAPAEWGYDASRDFLDQLGVEF